MSDNKKTHVVSVPGIIKKNGQMAMYGEEVSKDDFEGFSDRVDGNYVKSIADFKRELKEAGQEDEEDEAAKAASLKKANETKERNEMLLKYKSAFKSEAPEDASNAAIEKALNDKKAIV